MEEIWNRLEAWIDRYANILLDDLNPPAEEEDIEALEKVMLLEMPEDFKAFYKIHDGQFSESEDGLFQTEELLSTQRMLEEWKKWKAQFDAGDLFDLESEPEDAIRPEWWNPYWLPITASGTGNFYLLDFAPTREGNMGQVIRIKEDSPKRKVVASSFREFVERYVLALENNKFIYSERWGGVVSRKKADSFNNSKVEFGRDTEDDLDGFELVENT